MAETSTSELASQVSGAVSAVREAQAGLLDGTRKLQGHELDPAAHRIEEPESPFRKAIENIVMGVMLDNDLNSTAQKIIASRVSAAITSSLPDAIAAELNNPVSSLATLVGERINADVNKKIQNGDLGDAVSSLVSNAQETAKSAEKLAGEAKTAAGNAQSTANAAKKTADLALPKTANAVSASKLLTARNLQVNLASTAAAAFDGTANKDIGVKGNLPVANGGTGSNTAAGACDNLGAVKKSGNRGSLAGSETASVLTGSQNITATSADCVNIATSGAVTLTFTPAAANVRAVKAICLTASAATALSVAGAVWANNGSAPTWGDTGRILVLLAHFVGGRVVLSVADNTQ